MSEPSDIAVDAEGNIYVADKGNRRIHILAHDGKTVAQWSSRQDDKWSMEKPSGIAVYEDKIYVTDSSLNKVLIFFKDGRFIDEFGSKGSKPKQFNNPKGICVHNGIIYVADTDNDRIQIFSQEGVYLNSIGRSGDEVGEMQSPTDVAVDYKGYIYVTEAGNNRIGVFTPSGQHSRYYYDVSEPASIAVDKNGFFVSDAGNHKVKKISFNYNVLLSFGTKGDGHAQFQRLSGIALDNNGDLLVVDSGKNTIQIFSPEKTKGMPVEPAPPINFVRWLSEVKVDAVDMAWDGETLYATSEKEKAVLFIQEGIVRKLIRGDEKHRLNNPHGIAVDPSGALWVVDSGNNRIVKLNKEGNIISSIGGSGNAEGNFSSPEDITISKKGIVYVADTGNKRIQIFNTDGVFMSQIGNESLGEKIFDKPVDVDLDYLGNIFVVDKGEHRVLKLDHKGIVLFSIGKKGDKDGEFKSPQALFVTREEIFVLDSGNHRVQVFDHGGNFLRKFGARGRHKGDFIKPSSLLMKDDNVSIFVSDIGSGRIQAFNITYTPKCPLNLKASSGMREIILSWAQNYESYFDHYNIYRSEDKITFKLIGSSREPLYSDKNIKPTIPYLYRISAVAKEGNESEKSEVVEGKAKRLVTPPPQNIVAHPKENRVILQWQAPSEETALYIIYREVEGAFKEIGRVNTTSFLDKGLRSNTLYSYKITALSTDYEESKGAFIKTTTTILIPPVNITAVSKETEILLTWQAPSEETALYIIYREVEGAFKEIGRVSTTSFLDKGLRSNTLYSYKVTAVSSSNEESEGVFIKAGTLVIPHPINIAATPGEKEILLTWQSPKEGIASYVIYRDFDGTFREIGRANTTSFTDKGLKPDTSYTYKITTLYAGTEESEGAFVKATTIILKPPIEVTVVKMHDIFSRTYRIYEKQGIGRIKVNNNIDKPISNINVSFITKEFMDNPVDIEIKEISSGEAAELDIRPIFNNKIFSVKENMILEAEINVVYSFNEEVKKYSITHPLMVIPAGKIYTEDDIKRFKKAITFLNEKVLKLKMKSDEEIVKRIKLELDTNDEMINNLKARNMSYGEIIVCIYLSNQTGKSANDILSMRTGGQDWHEIMNSYDFTLSDIIYILNKVEKEIDIREKPKPKERRQETERGYFR